MSDRTKKRRVFAAILAGGSGARMGNPDKPKQFYLLGGKPILVHTVEKFCMTGLFDEVVVLSPRTWMRQTRDLVDKHTPHYAQVVTVLEGGPTRSDTILNALRYFEERHGSGYDDVVVTHDAVRPFVTYRIIEDNVKAAQLHGACDTVVPATDTIVESCDTDTISSIPDRSMLYQGQTPQSFNLSKLKAYMERLSESEKRSLTDACKIFVLNGEKVVLVPGDVSNMKITYPQDMRIAEALIGE